MVSHLVLLKARPDLSDAQREGLVAAFKRALREIPTVRSTRVGRRIVLGAGYEERMPDTADYLSRSISTTPLGLRSTCAIRARGTGRRLVIRQLRRGLNLRMWDWMGCGSSLARSQVSSGLELLRARTRY